MFVVVVVVFDSCKLCSRPSSFWCLYHMVNLAFLDHIYLDVNKPAKGKCLAKTLEITSA